MQTKWAHLCLFYTQRKRSGDDPHLCSPRLHRHFLQNDVPFQRNGKFGSIGKNFPHFFLPDVMFSIKFLYNLFKPNESFNFQWIFSLRKVPHFLSIDNNIHKKTYKILIKKARVLGFLGCVQTDCRILW